MRLNEKDLEILTNKLIDKGYTHYKQQKWKSSDSIFWKSFHKTFDIYGDKVIGYQVGFAIYDWSKYQHVNEGISISYEMLLGSDLFKIDRLDLSITDSKMTIEEFEEFCENLYQSEIIQNLKIK
jgi:hypothetical protein